MNPQEVCALHRQNRYDLILLDLQMPGMDGFQVMEGLKTNEHGRLPAGAGDHRPARPQAARAAGRRQGFHQQAVRPGRSARRASTTCWKCGCCTGSWSSYNKVLEQTVQERTAELRESEARYRSLTELASDWYWEQDENGNFTKVSGPVLEMLGMRVDGSGGARGAARGRRLERSGARRAAGRHRGPPALPRLRLQPRQRRRHRNRSSRSAASRCSARPAASSATAASAWRSREESKWHRDRRP